MGLRFPYDPTDRRRIEWGAQGKIRETSETVVIQAIMTMG